MSSIINGCCMGDDGAAEVKKGPIDLDYDSLITDEEPPQVVVVGRRISTFPAAMEAEEEDSYGQDNVIRNKSDWELGDYVQRMSRMVHSPLLKDGGAKLRISLHKHEVELKRRQKQKTVGDGLEKASDSPKEMNGVCKDVPHQAASAPSVKSSFSSPFCKKVEPEMDSGTDKAFGKELSTLNRCSSMPYDKKVNRRMKLLPVTEVTHRSPKIQSMSIDDEPQSSGMQKGRKRTRPPHLSGRGLFSTRKASLPTRSSSRFKRIKEETIVLLDVEECEPEETTQEDQGEQETLNRDTIIYYPSRNDSGSIEIHYSYMDCLAPQTYVSSTIMNFYIRYLQEKWPPLKITDEGERIIDYHLFNTFFYEKLKEAVTNKKADENSFAKLRRWWKNVKIFQKAYIFVPIHENSHWSLVIVCMPDKEDHHSGLLLLHLDSLGIHTSRPIFGNIKSFLKEEWKVVNDEAAYDVPIAESVWENLPRRIEEHTIEVPQQRNDYDCGLFVLYFMERFILDAPERLKKKNMKMFGKNWFNPKEASNLRRLIRELLEEKFQEEGEQDKDQFLEDSDLEASPKPEINILIE